jgi:hypothetical protein
MKKKAWLPINFQLAADVTAGAVILSGEDYQIINAKGAAKRALLVFLELADHWDRLGLINLGLFEEVRFGEKIFKMLTSDERMLLPAADCAKPRDINEIIGFAAALRRTRDIGFRGPLAASIYIERLALLLPLWDGEEDLPDDILIGRYLTGGIHISIHAERRILTLIPWLSPEDLNEIRRQAGFLTEKTSDKPLKDSKGLSKSEFALSGRSKLESFLREHVIDVIEHSERYKALGIDFPSSIVLHGPPGCGKTFAVERLIDYLDWPAFSIDSGSIGSPYIHETGRKIAEVFERAMQSAPAVVVIDEMEAFLADREIGSGGSAHRLEEVAEFLKRIPEANNNKVLVVGMTNRITMIDPALLRRGRFDHVIEIEMPGEHEVKALLISLLNERPCEDRLDIDDAAKRPAGRALSDVSFVVREAARLSAKSGKLHIDKNSFNDALEALLNRDGGKLPQKIGFN